MDNTRLDAALQELIEAERHLGHARSSYATITRSRFHALRMLWFSFKQMLGIRSEQDIYAVSSPGFTLPYRAPGEAAADSPLALTSKLSFSPAATEEQARIIADWSRCNSDMSALGAPIVTVVIPAYNHADVTLRCLQSIAAAWSGTVAAQFVVVDDASSDQTGSVLTCIPGLDYVRNGVNLGFVRSCNRGAQLARGKYICFLNNDTTVNEGWLDHLVARAESDEHIGIVGAKLIYPDGSLQEAGGIIWCEGTGWNYGRNGDPGDSRYNYVRDVDYCSGAALLVRSSLFGEIGGFSETFAPAYYEDVDLCFAARSRGYRVVYEPRAEVVHYEGISSGTDTSSGVKKFQAVNQPKFRAKWEAELEHHLQGDARRVPAAARRLGSAPTVLIVDSYVPMHDKDAGSARMRRIIEMLVKFEYRVIVLPDNYAALQPYTSELQSLGVEVLHHLDGGRKMDDALAEVLPLVDVAWICRPQLFEKYAPMVRRSDRVKVVYDMIDLHFLREKREAELLGNGSTNWHKMESLELSCARSADSTIVVSADEKGVLESYGLKNVGVIPTIHEVESRDIPGFETREGILFIGGYNHPPNVDAVNWLCSEIMPLVRQELGREVGLTLLGSMPSTAVSALASDTVRVTGYVANVDPFFLSSRVFVAPMRFGAGLKGKVGHSLGFGLPVVTTTIGSEGFGLTPEVNFLLADSKEQFAAAIVRLYSDRDLWEKISAGSLAAVEPFTSAAVAPQLSELLRGLLTRGEPALR